MPPPITSFPRPSYIPPGGDGPQGYRGFPGAAGMNGAPGSAGFPGSPGPTGFTGNVGAQGAQGSQGAQGAQGFQGVPGTVLGTFTPTFALETSTSFEVSYVTQIGLYMRTKNLVWFHIVLVFTPVYTGGSGEARIGGLPFASVYAGYAPLICLSTITYNTNADEVFVTPAGGQDYLTIIDQGNGRPFQSWGPTQFPSSTQRSIRCTGTYRTSGQ